MLNKPKVTKFAGLQSTFVFGITSQVEIVHGLFHANKIGYGNILPVQSMHIITKGVSSWRGVLDTTLYNEVCQ